MENPSPRLQGKAARDHFFKCIDKEAGTWQCRCGTKRKSGRGYANFMSHITSQHPEDYRKFQETNEDDVSVSNDQPGATSGGDCTLFFSKKAVQIHAWLELIILSLLPFSILNSDVLKRHIKYKPMTYHTFIKYMSRLTATVEKKIAKLLPNKFALVIDGWSSSGTHYLAVFATFASSNSKEYSSILLGFSPFEDETSLNADSHYEYIGFVLSEFNKSFDNVVALVADNCAVNISLVNKIGCGFIGCASHRFNLAMKDMIKDDTILIEKVQAVMQKLRWPIPAAKLRRHTLLCAKCANVTRWSSTADMLVRYKEIRPVLKDVEVDDLDSLLPTARENKRIDELCVKFEELNSVTKALQNESLTCADARSIFDEVIEQYPSTEGRLSSSADIVATEDFENAVVKIMNDEGNTLTASEKVAAVPLLKDVLEVPETNDANESLAQRALKRRKQVVRTADKYLDLHFLCPTSNICERFFSKAGHALTDRRQSINPSSFEQQMFLHMNASLWGTSDVESAIQERATPTAVSSGNNSGE